MRTRAADESGAILVITAIMLVAMIGLAALAIDVGSFYQAQRQAQAAADAGALAGADALAAGASAASVTTTATNQANTNYPSATPPTAIVNGSSVTVSVANTTPTYFGQIFGITKENVAARAVAAGTPAQQTPCTTAGNGCWAVWASDTSCTNYGVDITAGSMSVSGGIHSNGSIRNSAGSGSFGGVIQYGDGSGCQFLDQGGSASYSGGKQSVPASTGWPIDYSLQYPKCGTGLKYQCTGPDGTPSYCRFAASTYSISSSIAASSDAATRPDIYCAYGSGTKSDPSTYTGSVSFGGGSENVSGTFIGGSMSITAGSITVTPTNYQNGAGNHLLFYAATGDITLSGGSGNLPGDMFAPTGTINNQSGSNTATFLEAKDVILGAGSLAIRGDGPSTSTGGTSSSGVAALTQ